MIVFIINVFIIFLNNSIQIVLRFLKNNIDFLNAVLI